MMLSKNHLKWMTVSNIKAKTVKLTKIKQYICNFGTGKVFLGKTQKIIIIQQKTDK